MVPGGEADISRLRGQAAIPLQSLKVQESPRGFLRLLVKHGGKPQQDGEPQKDNGTEPRLRLGTDPGGGVSAGAAGSRRGGGLCPVHSIRTDATDIRGD